MKTSAIKRSRVKEKKSWINKDITIMQGLSDKVKKAFFSELSMLISSGLDLDRSLGLVLVGMKKKEQLVVHQIINSLRSGNTLHKAIENTGKFSQMEVYTIMIGEQTGKLEDVCKELADQIEKKIDLRNQLISVLTYPSFILGITFLVIWFMLSMVVPMFSDVFQQFGGELPQLTQHVISASEFFSDYYLILVLTSLVILGVHYSFRKNSSYKSAWHKILSKIIIIGELRQKMILTDFSQNLGFLSKNHVPLSEALLLYEKATKWYIMKEISKSMIWGLEQGQGMSHMMEEKDIFPKKMVAIIRASEEVNNLPKSFISLAKSYNKEVEELNKSLGKLIEPVMIIVIGAFVAVILIAMYLPMFQLGNVM